MKKIGGGATAELPPGGRPADIQPTPKSIYFLVSVVCLLSPAECFIQCFEPIRARYYQIALITR